MKILISYDETELRAIENMGAAINNEIGYDEEVKILREKLTMLSPYAKAEILPRTANGASIALDVKTDYIRDICGTVTTNASKFVAVGKAIASLMEAFKAMTPGFNDLRRIIATALKLEPVSGKEKKAA